MDKALQRNPEALQSAPEIWAQAPSRDDGVTMAGLADGRSGPSEGAEGHAHGAPGARLGSCPICGNRFVQIGRRRYCCQACRQKAHRWRHPRDLAPLPAPPGPRAETVYECPTCEARLLGEQRSEDCNSFCRRVGPGGPCPHCDEPVAVSDLIEPAR